MTRYELTFGDLRTIAAGYGAQAREMIECAITARHADLAAQGIVFAIADTRNAARWAARYIWELEANEAFLRATVGGR